MERFSAHTNLFDFWKEQIQVFKWKNALINTAPFNETDLIVEKLLSFFPKKDFELANSKNFKNNFISHQLLGDHRSIYVLAEYASCIQFLNDHPELDLNNLSSNLKINYPEVRNRFFEIFINRILTQNGLNPNFNSSYTRNGNLTPLDRSIQFNGERYLIECVKLHDQKKELISDLTSETIGLQKKLSDQFSHEELMGGYLEFKKPNITPHDKNIAIENFRLLLKNYFQTFRNNKTDVLNAHQRFTNKSIHIEIMPLNSFETREKEIYESLNNGITFSHEILGSLQGTLRLNYKVKLSYQGLEDLVSEKIRKKKKQHKDSPFRKKIIAIEIENSYGINRFENSIPAKPETFATNKVASMLDDNTALIIVLKSLEKTERKIEWGFACNNKFDQSLKSILTAPKMKWR